METPKFALLADAYTKDLAEFQRLTKSRIVGVAELELKATQHAIIRLIVDCTLFLAKASVISDCRLKSQEQEQICLRTTIALSATPFQTMASNCNCNIETLLATALGLPNTPAPPGTHLDNWTSGSFQQLIITIFIHSNEAYNNAISANLTAQRLANLSHEHWLEQTTEAMAIEIDKEPIIDSATINSLIAQQVKEATKHLCRELGQAQSSKKKQRGPQKQIQTQSGKTVGNKEPKGTRKETADQHKAVYIFSVNKPRLVKKEITKSESILASSLSSKKVTRPKVGIVNKDSSQKQRGSGRASSSRKGTPSHGRLLSPTKK